MSYDLDLLAAAAFLAIAAITTFIWYRQHTKGARTADLTRWLPLLFPPTSQPQDPLEQHFDRKHAVHRFRMSQCSDKGFQRALAEPVDRALDRKAKEANLL